MAERRDAPSARRRRAAAPQTDQTLEFERPGGRTRGSPHDRSNTRGRTTPQNDQLTTRSQVPPSHLFFFTGSVSRRHLAEDVSWLGELPAPGAPLTSSGFHEAAMAYGRPRGARSIL